MTRKKPAFISRGKPSARYAAGIGFHLREAYRAFNRSFRERLAQYGITHSQFMVLWLLSRTRTLTPLELAKLAGVQKAAGTSVIDSLKKRRLIAGDRDVADRRKINLYLTKPGFDLMQHLLDCAAETNADATFGISDKELETVLRILRAVVTNLDEREYGRMHMAKFGTSSPERNMVEENLEESD